jgi:hypothetical protein
MNGSQSRDPLEGHTTFKGYPIYLTEFLKILWCERFQDGD